MDCVKIAELGSEKADPIRQSLTLPLNVAIIPPLFDGEVQERGLMRKVLGLQALIALIAAAITAFCYENSFRYGLAVLCGGSVSALNTAMWSWRLSRLALTSEQSAYQQLRLMYFYAAERFLAVIVALGIGMVALGLLPLAVIGGFILGQAAALAGRMFLKIKTEDSD